VKRRGWPAGEATGKLVEQRQVVGAVPRLVEMECGVEILLIQERQDQHPPTRKGSALAVGHVDRRKGAILHLILFQGEADLAEVVLALDKPWDVPFVRPGQKSPNEQQTDAQKHQGAPGERARRNRFERSGGR
jgi:hypothetical protein